MSLDDDNFRIRPGKVRDRGSARPPRAVRQRANTFMGAVHRAIRRAGGNPNRGAGKGSGRFNAHGRGAAVAAGLKGRNGWSREGSGVRTRSRRVAVKARVVKLNPQRGGTRGRQFVSGKAVDAHLRYLERDGVTRNGEKGQIYSADKDVADGRAFLDRGREDRHQFRFIVSAEEGVDLADLRVTTRDLMTAMESDLGTKLDWIAVDHHNTGHPHTHILMRGVTDDGRMLNIAGDYIAHGVRERADLSRDGAGTRVTVRSPITLDKQIGHDGATWLDRELTSTNRTPPTEAGFGRDVAIALERRKQALAEMGHAIDLGNGRFRAPKDLIQRLERGEVERTGRALAAERGRTWQPAVPGNYVTGKLVGSTQLASGRFAMIDDGMGFSLVPGSPRWRSEARSAPVRRRHARRRRGLVVRQEPGIGAVTVVEHWAGTGGNPSRLALGSAPASRQTALTGCLRPGRGSSSR